MKKNNIREFKALILKYESITLEDIEKEFKNNYFNPYIIANNLTGFGRLDTCSLCKSASNNCFKCLYCESLYREQMYGCYREDNRYTYSNIIESKTPPKLLIAFRKRAKHMRKILDMLKLKQPCKVIRNKTKGE